MLCLLLLQHPWNKVGLHIVYLERFFYGFFLDSDGNEIDSDDTADVNILENNSDSEEGNSTDGNLS